jgi:N6-adenosine-specific RNA methylase IME4
MTEQRRWKTILVDFPWPGQGGEKHYRTESLARLREFPLGDLAENDAHIWFWTTNRFLRESYDILESHGFTVRSPLTWVKFRLGLGGPYGLRNATEHCLFATRGHLPVQNRSTPTWLNAPVTSMHSEKPAELYKIIARVSPGPRLETFARHHEPGWDVWGDSIESTVSIPNWPVPSDEETTE